MPIYEYRCECGNEGEVILPLSERNQPQTCDVCGKVTQRKVSLPMPAIFAQNGRDMALDSLNSKTGGFPSRKDALRDKGIRAATAGLDPPKRTIGRGF